MALGQVSGSQLLFTGVRFVRPALGSRTQVPRCLAFAQLPWPTAGIGMRVALPSAEEMLSTLGASHHRMFPLAMVTMLVVAIRFNPSAHAQDAPTASGVQRQVQSVGNNSTQEGNSMEAVGLLVTLEARPGKEADAETFLKSAQPLALNENGTLKWYAIKLGPGKFGIFDTFANEAGRNAHLNGEIAKALGARASELFATAPQIDKVEILATTPLKN
jgi:quinol monooxygenase YgiN